VQSETDYSLTSLILGVVVVALCIWVIVWNMRRLRALGSRRQTPERAAGRMALKSLHEQVGGTLDEDSVRFERAGFSVRIALEPDPRSDSGVTSLEISGDLVPIGVSPEPPFAVDVRTGDAEFDGFAVVRGDPVMALAVLDAKARRVTERALMAGFVMRAAPTPHLRFQAFGLGLDPVMAQLETGLEVARNLRRPDDLLTTLARRLCEERRPEGRLAIAARLPTASLDQPALRDTVLAHPDAGMRLYLANRLNHPSLWSTLPEATLIALLGDPHEATMHLAITSLGRLGSVLAVPALEDKKADGRETQRLASEAILHIQSRASGSRGDLALVSGETGALALSEPEPGGESQRR